LAQKTEFSNAIKLERDQKRSEKKARRLKGPGVVGEKTKYNIKPLLKEGGRQGWESYNISEKTFRGNEDLRMADDRGLNHPLGKKLRPSRPTKRH